MRGCLLGCCVGFQLHCTVPVCEMQEGGTRALQRRASAPCMSVSAVRTCSESKISSVTDTPSPFSDHLPFHPPMSPPFVSLSLFVFFLLPLSSSVHPQEGQPEEAQGSTNAQALEAAAAATVSALQTRLMPYRWELALCLVIEGAWNVSESHKGMASAPLGWKTLSLGKSKV